MNPDFSKNHFELFGLPVAFAVDGAALDRAYREVQREVHPDRFTIASDAEKRLAAQWATRANEAYQTLKSPLSRGRYLLRINGIDTEEESNTAMPVDFLMQQMEWREAVVDARRNRDEARLGELAARHRADEAQLFMQLAAELAVAPDMPGARLTVRKLRFLEKLGEEIDDAFEFVDA
ncbi:MAG TPA: Fe-S protein assembly co-chaperone HscB [Usitatibacteraceae bacterium]